MKKNGFTLIELLAVIVILAIIALIATPIVLNIIEDSKKSAFEQTANGIIKAAEYYYMKEMSDGEKTTQNKVFTFDESTNVISGLEFDGDVPKKGQIMITENGKVSMSISNGEYCITKLVNEEKLIFSESNEECAFPDAVNGIMSSKDYCIVSGKCKNGTLVTVQVNDTEKHDFYVINDNNDEIMLIMDRNLGPGTPWYSARNYNGNGPLTALEVLQTSTINWENIPIKKYIISDDGGGHKYSDIIVEMRATMPTMTHLKAIVQDNNNVMPQYLYGVFADGISGYWTTAALSAHEYCAMAVIKNVGFYNADTASGVNVCKNNTCGVRPVITLST